MSESRDVSAQPQQSPGGPVPAPHGAWVRRVRMLSGQAARGAAYAAGSAAVTALLMWWQNR